jgi:Siphovirus ReqiPepy6 Gp37-like protein
MAIDLLVTDRNLIVQGDPLDGWTDLQATLRYNEPGPGSVTLPAWPEYMQLLQPGNRLVVIRDGEIWSAGPMEIPQDYSWGVGGDVNEPDPGKVVLNFADDLARVAGYITYPDPTKTFSAQATATDAVRQITATNAETIIRTLVNENCGPGALAPRRIEQLALGAVAGVGSNTAISTRFEALLDACRTVAATDGLGFRTRQDMAAGRIVFEVYASTDRTATARFSAGLGNLRSVQYKMSAPTATAELVQGGDTGTRAYVEVNSGAATDWYRVEKLVDQSGTTNANGELTQAGTLEFGNDNPTASLATVTVDTEDLQAGRDFGLGDRVTIELPTGLEVADVVRAITLTATPDGGELVTSVIGTPDATTSSATVQVIRNLARRLGRLEAR